MKTRAVMEEDLARVAAAPLPWQALEGTTVLITGATGFIAAYLVEALLFLNREVLLNPVKVLALARNPAKAARRFGHLRDDVSLRMLHQDACAPLATDIRFDHLIHAASPANPRDYLANPAGTLLANTVATANLLQAAVGYRARSALFLSSGEVYGHFDSPPADPLTESDFGSLDPLDPRSCYAEGKRAGEALCAAWSKQYRFSGMIGRLGHTYGPGMELGDGRVATDFLANVIRRQPIEMKSAGLAVRPFCYLTDAVIGLLTVMLRGAGGQAYNVVNDEAFISVRDLARTLVELFPDRNLTVRGALDGDIVQGASNREHILVDTSKLRGLGWKPVVSVREGFSRTVRSYEESQPCAAAA